MWQKISDKESAYTETVTDGTGETSPLEIFARFGASLFSGNSFAAVISFAAAYTGTIQVHAGLSRNNLVHIPDWDMVISSDAGPHTFDIKTSFHYVKFVFSGSGYTATVEAGR
jgi:hypothetical protein